MSIWATGALLVLAGCGGGDGAETPVSRKRPCDILPNAGVEKSVGIALVAAGTQCSQPKAQPGPQIDAEAYKLDDQGRIVVGGPYHGHCLRITGYGSRINGSQVTVASATDLLRTARDRMGNGVAPRRAPIPLPGVSRRVTAEPPTPCFALYEPSSTQLDVQSHRRATAI
ncbi:hypothetical protein [Streptomyces sp. YS-3]|uniref:hypothetical protein n=1 Tax=Streptomyces sp. YS-3 TaxID=3381352 RepID=UPI003862290B